VPFYDVTVAFTVEAESAEDACRKVGEAIDVRPPDEWEIIGPAACCDEDA